MKLSLAPAPVISVLRLFLSTLIFQSIGPGKASAQSYNYIHYRSAQGFKATNAYCLFQDSKGYLWIGTENGLMRFNGRDFKVFTARDGLPDNEILNISEDAYGRLWLVPFASTVCYIQNGIVYHSGNSSILRGIRFKGRAQSIIFDKDRNVWIVATEQVVRVGPDGKVERVSSSSLNKTTTRYCAMWPDSAGVATLAVDSMVYYWDGKRFMRSGVIPFPYVDVSRDAHMVFEPSTGKLVYRSSTHSLPPAPRVYSTSWSASGQLMLATDKGARILDVEQGIYTDSFLCGYKVGAFREARDGSFWIGTIGNGLYNIRRTALRSLETDPGNASVRFIKGTGNGVYCATYKSKYVGYTQDAGSGTWRRTTAQINAINPYEHYVFVGRNKAGDYICCANWIDMKQKLDGPVTKRYMDKGGFGNVCKAALEEGDSLLLVATNDGIIRFDKDKPGPVDTFLPGIRTVAVAKIGAVIYAGTLNGLMACRPGMKPHQVMAKARLLQGHIMSLCAGKNDMLWAANNRAELVGLQHDTVVTVTGLKEGLQCNRISCIKASGELLWIGTDNGLYAVMQRPPYKIVRHITYASGLSSDQVNCLDIYRKRVWVGTVSGINYFDEEEVLHETGRNTIVVNSIKNGKRLLTAAPGVLALKERTLTVDFDVVDYTSSSKPIFQYRLNDKDEWLSLEDDHLYFPSLPYGNFVLTIRAFAPNWSTGAVFRQRFSHPEPFYRSGWFMALAGLALTAGVIAVSFLIVRKTREKDARRIAIQQNLLQLEQLALQGQMNPHFIFNCIAAIKHYYSTGDTAGANRFVDDFALLIRQTFEMGVETFITLDKELAYLTQYLNVEQARFNHSFRFTIEKHAALPGSTPVPVMLLQPLVENAIRHGIRHLPDGAGKIDILVKQEGAMVIFEVSDNGIGFRKSKALKGPLGPAVLTSTTLNYKRIDILNKLFGGQIMLITEDLSDSDGPGTGTRIIISYPVTINQNDGK